MMAVAATSVACVEDLMKKIGSVQGVQKRVHHVYSEDELLDKTKGIGYPCVGVVYDGMRAIGESGATAKQGHSAELVCTVMFFFRQETNAVKDAKFNAVDVLDKIRGVVKGTRSPSGHLWKFQLEAAVGGKNGVLAYIQRWSCPIQLT